MYHRYMLIWQRAIETAFKVKIQKHLSLMISTSPGFTGWQELKTLTNTFCRSESDDKSRGYCLHVCWGNNDKTAGEIYIVINFLINSVFFPDTWNTYIYIYICSFNACEEFKDQIPESWTGLSRIESRV